MHRVFFALVLGAAFLSAPTPVAGQDDQYVRIYGLIQEADTLNRAGQVADAHAKYVAAQTALQKFQRTYPDWNENVISFRISYLTTKIAEVSAKLPVATVTSAVASTSGPATAAAPKPAASAPPPEYENQLNALREQVRQLQSEKTLLESKLKEAFAAQPAAMDPRELASALETIRSLQKENALLQVTVAQRKGGAPTDDSAATEQLRRELAEARRLLAEQRDQANAMALERSALQARVNNVNPPSRAPADLEANRRDLEEARRRLQEQTDLASRLAQEKEALQSRVKALTAEAETITALRSENEFLKKMAASKPAAAEPVSGDANRLLTEARAQIAALQSDREIWRLERIALEQRVKTLSSPPAITSVMPPPQEESARVKKLEEERDELQRKLEAAQKELYGRNSRRAVARVEELTGRIDVLRSRLGVYEAQAIPYTPEELALFKVSQAVLPSTDRRAGKKSVSELPAGTVTLIAQAQRDFNARRFDEAEAKYKEVLKQDEQNINTLANLATIQLEMNQFDEAEKNIKQALTVVPDDAYSLSILGNLKFRQGKFDDAMDALSQAAKLDPKNAQIQNFLGLTLSQKGMRAQAETALRKAVQLEPGYKDAHYNLAVIYVTQKPPLTELARWHYDKAIAGGFPRNTDMEKMLGEKKAAVSN